MDPFVGLRRRRSSRRALPLVAVRLVRPMRISDLELFLVSVPRGGTWPPVRALLVRLATSDGYEGWGEARVAWRTPELAPRRDLLLAALVGRAVHDLAEL